MRNKHNFILFWLVSVLINTSLFADPVPDIKANSSDDPITIETTDTLNITVELSAGSNTGDNADWWGAAAISGNWYTYVHRLGWNPGISVAFQGVLFDLSSTSIFTGTLPVGTYTFYFAVDSNMDGSVNYDQLHYDYVEVNVTQSNSDIGTIWVHVSHMGNAVWTILGIPTGHMQLVDASGARMRIEPWGCITLGGSPKNYSYSAWAIDQVTRISPTQEQMEECASGDTGFDALGNRRCIAAWYQVDIPPGFRPVEYNAGCALFDSPFDFL